MVIQRWQSVYLLLAIFAMILVFIRPFGIVVEGENIIEVISLDYPVLLVINILIVILLLLDIFLFKNLRLQRRVAAIIILFIVTSAVTSGIILTGNESLWHVVWTGAPVGIITSLICTILASSRMKADENLLKSYDRIR